MHCRFPGSVFFALGRSVSVDLREPAGPPVVDSHETDLQPLPITNYLQKVHNREPLGPRPLPPIPAGPKPPRPLPPIPKPARFQQSRNVGLVLRPQRFIASNSIIQ